MSTPERERQEELAALGALGIADGAERAELAALAASDPSVAALARDLHDVVAATGAAVPQIEPPAALRARVLASVAGTAPAAPAQVVDIRRDARPASAPSRSLTAFAWLAAAASLVAAVGLGLWAMQLRAALDDVDARLAAAEREVVTIRQTLGASEQKTRLLQAQAQVFLAPDLARVDLAGQPAAPGAQGRAFWSRNTGMVFAASSLPVLPADKVYQVWVIAEAAPAPISAGLVEPDPQGNALVMFRTPADIPTPKVLAVTLEPAGGVPAPTGDKVLVGTTGL